MTPKVSIIVPVYNTEKYLRPCLDSIQAQTFKDFEAVLVDDGSTDKSGEICDEYAAKDSRFVVVHKQNEGVTKARITAFEHSKGEYITFIDSDDIVHSCYIDKLYNTAIGENADIVCCQVIRVYGNKKIEETNTIFGTYDTHGIHHFLKNNYLYDPSIDGTGMPLYLCAKLFKKEVLYGGLHAGEGLKLGEDQIGLFYMLLRINSITLIPDYLYEYIMHEGQTTDKYRPDFWDNKLEVFRRYKKIDVDNILADQLPLRMWVVLIKGIEWKMLPALSSYNNFKEMVVPVLQDDVFQTLFCRRRLQLRFRKNIKFWMLKYKCYYIYYILFIRRRHKNL